jgi:hypothetical protein
MAIDLFDIEGEFDLLQEVSTSHAMVLRGFAILHRAGRHEAVTAWPAVIERYCSFTGLKYPVSSR